MKYFLIILSICVVSNSYAQRKGYWQQAVDYTIKVDVNEKKFQYDGEMALKYTNNSGQDLNKVYFHLYFNAFQPGSMMDYRLSNIADPDRRMVNTTEVDGKKVAQSKIATLTPDQVGYQQVESLLFDGQATSFKVDGTILEVTLPKPLKAGEVGAFAMKWKAQVPEQIRRSGRNSAEGVALSMTQWYPKMAHFDDFGWHLDEYVAREFVAPFGNFDVTVNIDKDYVIGGSGKLQNPSQVKGYDVNARISPRKGKVAWHFKAENIHDFAWAADPKFQVDSVQTKGGTTVYAVFLPTDQAVISNWKTALGLASEFFDFTSEHFGKYPWQTYSIVQGGDGGMEYGTATLITGGRNLRGLVSVIFHEAAHSWYQHLFGVNETVDEWLDEGFTSYIQDLAIDALFVKNNSPMMNPILGAYQAYYRLALSGSEEPMSLLADYYNTNYAYSNEAYSKGAVLAEQLGYIIGKQNLKKTFLTFYDIWKLKNPTPNDFKRVAENVSDINLKWYFNLFVNTTRIIDYSIAEVEGNEIKLQNKGGIAMPIDLLVEYEDGSKELFYIPLREMRGEKPAEEFAVYQGVKRTVLEDWFWTNPYYTLSGSKEVKSVQIDPTQRLADVKQEDNRWEK